MDDRHIEPGSDTDLAIERALEAANLRAGGASETSVASVANDWEPAAAELGDLSGAGDGE